MIEPSVTLQFSEEQNEFRYLYFQEQQGTFKDVCGDIGITDAVRFVEWVRGVFPHPLIYASVICQWNVWKLKNNL